MQITSTKGTLEPTSPEGQSAQPKEKTAFAKRFLVGFGFFCLGAAAIGAGGLSIWSRLNQFTIDNGIINARITRVRAPIPGQFSAVYANPGVQVKAGQVLARIKPTAQQEQVLLLLQGERQTNLTQLLAAEQSLSQTRQQLAELDRAGSAVVAADSSLAESAIQARQSEVDQVRSRVEEAQTAYERYRQLALEGAIAQSLVDERKANLDAQEAALKGAQAALEESQKTLTATKSGAKNSPSGLTVSDQRARLVETIKTQSSLAATLKAQLESVNQRLKQTQSQFSDKQDLVVTAPSSGVVYSIASERSEQVNQLEPVLTLLDCQNVWVEGIVSSQQASQIDTRQPVRVNLAGETRPLQGEVELMQAVGNAPVPSANAQGVEHINVTQLQALTPPVKADLAGQPLMRVIIRIQPSPKLTQPQQFCGVGQIAQVTFSKKSLGF